jgi:transcription factor S
MEFCPKCGGMIKVENKIAVCMSCGHKPKKTPKIEASEKITHNEKIAVIKEGQDNTNPIIDITCPRCKNKKAYFWTLQTRAADESETKFYKCTKCSHTWRVYR